jgi:hypothetical protein
MPGIDPRGTRMAARQRGFGRSRFQCRTTEQIQWCPARRRGEQPDRTLPALVVAVEKFHHEEGASLDVLPEPAVIRIRDIAR